MVCLDWQQFAGFAVGYVTVTLAVAFLRGYFGEWWRQRKASSDFGGGDE